MVLFTFTRHFIVRLKGFTITLSVLSILAGLKIKVSVCRHNLLCTTQTTKHQTLILFSAFISFHFLNLFCLNYIE